VPAGGAAEPAGRASEPAGPARRAAELAGAARAGDRRALARLLTAVENRTPVAEHALRSLYALAGRAHLVGITGPPGAGKSTLVAALIAELRRSGRTVAVVAVDPSSPITGGALLGDRVRMQAYAEDDGVFIRSMAARGHAGGLAPTSTAAAAVLDASGFEVVLLETVGTGQSEVEVAAAADTTVVLEAPEMGDEIQAIKAGLLEVADLVVVNKGDRPGAQRTAAQLRAMLGLMATPETHAGHDTTPPIGAHGAGGGRRPTDAGRAGGGTISTGGWDAVEAPEPTGAQGPSAPYHDRPHPGRPDVLVTTATTGEGVPELLAALDAHRGGGGAGSTAASRRRRAEWQVRAVLADRLWDRLTADGRSPATDATLDAVAAHELDPYAAADRLLAALAERDAG
jgi:LAO/AO transport system kinase